MDPTTLPPPSPEKSSQPPPQNPHISTTVTDASAFDCYQKDDPSANGNTDTFKALVSKLAGRLLPAHQSLIERRLDDMIPDELLVPNHPSYADMILTALWELNTDGGSGSSEEAISDFILKEYHELPWAHATILNHNLRDLRMKRKIIMTHDRLYQLCLSTTKPLPTHPNPNPNLNLNDTSSSSPISSPSSSSSSASHWSSPTSSSSSLDWDLPYRRRKQRKRNGKRKRKKGRGGKMVQVRVRVRSRGKGKGRGSGRGRGRGRQPKMVHVTSDEDEATSMEVEEDDGGEKQNNNEVMEKGFLVESQTEVMVSQKVEEQNGNGKQKGEMVELRRSGRRRNGVREEHNIGAKEEYQQKSGAEVIKLEDDVINGDGDEHVESLKQEEEKDARNVEHKEEGKCEEQETEVSQEPIHQQEQCVEMTIEKLESCGQDLLKNVSTEEQPQHEEQETEINQKESGTVVIETDETIDPQVEVEVSKDGNKEEKPNKVNEKDTEEQVELQNEEIVTCEHESDPINKVTVDSESQEDDTVVEKIEPQKPLREGLRSSYKKQEPTPKVKKQLEQVTPVRRSLRPRKTTEETDIVVEDPDQSKEQLEYSGRTRSSKRISKSCEAEQVSKSRKTRRKYL